MEKYAVKKLNKKNNINASVPGSKSITNRALMLAAMSDGICTLNGVLFSSDSRAFIDCLISLGFSVQIDERSAKVVIKGEMEESLTGRLQLMFKVQEQQQDS